jgi:hypothetical protein
LLNIAETAEGGQCQKQKTERRLKNSGEHQNQMIMGVFSSKGEKEIKIKGSRVELGDCHTCLG